MLILYWNPEILRSNVLMESAIQLKSNWCINLQFIVKNFSPKVFDELRKRSLTRINSECNNSISWNFLLSLNQLTYSYFISILHQLNDFIIYIAKWKAKRETTWTVTKLDQKKNYFFLIHCANIPVTNKLNVEECN